LCAGGNGTTIILLRPIQNVGAYYFYRAKSGIKASVSLRLEITKKFLT